MPYIIKNGKTYTGNSVTLTQAQYDALSEAEKNNGIAYYIYDSDTVLDADDVALDSGTVEDLAGSVAVIETSPATAIHSVGDFILWNGQLYSVIAPIRVGQDLTVGSNITATSAGSELTSLKSGLSNLNGAYQNETLATFYADVKASLFKGFASTGAFTQKLTKNFASGAGTGYATYNSQYDFVEGVFYMNSNKRLYAFRVDNDGTLSGCAYLAMTAA